MADNKAILTIETAEPDRPFVEINGKNYSLNLPDDFGIRDFSKLRRMQKRYLDIEGKDPDDFDEADEQLLAETLEAMTAMLLRDCPPEVQERLNFGHRAALVEAFGKAVGIGMLGTRPPEPNRATRRSPSTSPASSRPSSASTAATRRAG